MKRPTGIIVSSVLLGLIACFQLLFALLTGFSAVVTNRMASGASAGASVPMPHWMPIITAVVGLFLLLLAAWSITTIVGLARLRSWARYSILVIGGCMAALGAFSALGIVSAAIFLPSAPGISNAPSHHVMRMILASTAIFYGLIAAVGIGWLIYFNRAAAKALFAANAPLVSRPPHTVTGRPRPTAITIFAILFLVSAPLTAVDAFLPFPAFLLGFSFPGMSGHLVYAGCSLLSALLGYGLFRLYSAARIGAIGLVVLGLINALLVLTPWYRVRFDTYMQTFWSGFPSLALVTAPFPVGYLISIMLLGSIFNLFILWMLHRHRVAFTPAPPAPPLSLTPQFTAA